MTSKYHRVASKLFLNVLSNAGTSVDVCISLTTALGWLIQGFYVSFRNVDDLREFFVQSFSTATSSRETTMVALPYTAFPFGTNIWNIDSESSALHE